MGARTALVNEARGLLHEYGITIPQGRRVFAKLLPELLLTHGERLSSLTREIFYDLLDEENPCQSRLSHQGSFRSRIHACIPPFLSTKPLFLDSSGWVHT